MTIECVECKETLGEKSAPVCGNCHDAECDDREEHGRETGKDIGRSEFKSNIPHRELMELAAAIRRGDITSAEMSLDVIARDMEGWPEAIDQGRFSRKAA